MPKKSKAKRKNKETPGWIKVISILYFLYGTIALLIGIFFTLLFLGFGGPLLDLAAPFVISLTLIVLIFITGIGLLIGKNWARVAAIVLSIIGILISAPLVIEYFAFPRGFNQFPFETINLTGLSFYTIFLLSNILIPWYLLTSAKAKEFFKSNTKP